MSKKKRNKQKSKKYYQHDNYFTNNKTKTKSYVSSKDIKDIAFKVFGSTYFTP
jgi:hypothetical protein